MPSLQTFLSGSFNNFGKNHLSYYLLSEHKCNKAEVKCVLTESRQKLRVFSRRRQSRATYQSANIYDAFIFRCNYEHLFWAPIMSTYLRQWTVFTYFRLQANGLALNTIYILDMATLTPVSSDPNVCVYFSALVSARLRAGAGGVWRVSAGSRAPITRSLTSSSILPTSPQWAGCPISRWSVSNIRD